MNLNKKLSDVDSEHQLTLTEIADVLYRTGKHKEYKALIAYRNAISAFLDEQQKEHANVF